MKPEVLRHKIHIIRDQKVMLDVDLADLYGIQTKVLKQAVRRNIERFPADFMFELNKEETDHLRSQFVTSSEHGGNRYGYFAFTEQGVAMLSSVLRSPKAIEANIRIVRAFVFLRQYAQDHSKIEEKLSKLEAMYNKKFEDIYQAINYLLQKDKKEIEQTNRKKIGYNA